MSNKALNIVLKIVVNICRFMLAVTFLFSGFVKANDPLGMVYKLEDYFSAWGINAVPEPFTLSIAIGIAFFEFILGEYDLKKEDLVTNHSDYTMADTRGIIDIEVREGRIEGTFYQKSSYRLGRFYDFDLVYQKED